MPQAKTRRLGEHVLDPNIAIILGNHIYNMRRSLPGVEDLGVLISQAGGYPRTGIPPREVDHVEVAVKVVFKET